MTWSDRGRYLVFGVVLLLVLGAVAPAALSATSVVIADPSQVDLHGPRIDQITYQYYDDTTAAIASHAIMGNELSLDAASYNNFASDSHLTSGSTLKYDDQGIQFNMLRPVTNNTNFRRAMLYLQDFSYYQTTMLSGVAGTAVPTMMPCALYASACKNGPGQTAAEGLYGAFSLLKAVNELKATESDPNPNSRLFEGNTSDITCTTDNGALCSNLSWHVGSATGPVWVPNWIGRGSLLRHQIAVYIQSQAAKIGLDLSTGYTEYVSYSQAAPFVAQQSLAAIIHDGVYNAKTGFNSAPVYNSSRSTVPGEDTWDFYSFGYGYTGTALFNDAESFNSAYGSAQANVGLFYNATVDKDTNGVIYAKTVDEAATAIGRVSLDFMQNLPWQNVYLTNDLWVVLTDSWSGYVSIPTQTPTSLTGLFYTLLNVHQNCFPSTCKTGGTINIGLAAKVDAPGGLTPAAQFNSVYDADITGQIYDSPTITGPDQFTSPGTYTSWMVSTMNVNSYNGTVTGGPNTGVFLLQSASQTAPQKIAGGQAIVMDFLPDIYFSDHVQMTAYDYNFSLYASNIALTPGLSDSANIFSGVMAGPTGLIGTYINPAKPLEITLYVNSSTVWNPTLVIVPVVPQHIFKFFNMDTAYSLSSTFDTSFNYNGTIQSANGCVSCTNPKAGAPPVWLTSLPNLEVGTGPFILRSWDGVGQHGILMRNPTYFRAAWSMNDSNNVVMQGNPFTFKSSVYEWTHDSVVCASSVDHVCQVPISTGVTAVLNLLDSSGASVKSFPLTCDSHGICSGSIPTGSGFQPGDNELAFIANYTYLGLPRTWYQLTGESVTPVATTSTSTSTTSTTSSSSSSTTTSSTSSTSGGGGVIPEFPPQIGIAAVVTVVIIASYVLARRLSGPGLRIRSPTG
jgi:hypothetical protein